MSCLSQWWTVEFEVDNIKIYSAEQFMMAEKARLFNDIDILKKLLISTSPKEVKQLGRQVKNFNENVWKKERYEIVKRGNLAKFSQNEDLKNYLLSTKNKVLSRSKSL
ncbi:NADAR family protein [Clostridium gasigenes]|uniref:NADAR family protein n=1 Tax=Clostridium gasigenes TaxID=94869 RepID=UPI0033962F8B